jgi:2-keto-4-pentenoate hydratase/2-oxohepta-3-ene-1,7-dioic acid hydratase in catechol pathway
MRYCRFQTEAGPQYGEITDRAGELWIERLLPPFEEDPWTKISSGTFKPLPLNSVQLLAPVVPRKILCIGRNYRDHAAELGSDVPKEPLLFLKPSSSIIGPGDAIRIPHQSQRVDFEGELAVVIGKKASHIGADQDVSQYIRGYTIVNDVTARDLQKTDDQWARAKGFDTFCPIGPLVTDEIDPAAGIAIQTHLNGEIKQDGNTHNLIFPIDALLRYITAAITLYPGDLIPTGTPAGVAPMQPGDRVSVTIEGIETLENAIA